MGIKLKSSEERVMAKKLRAVIIAVKDLEAAVATYTDVLGQSPSQVASEAQGGRRNAIFPLGEVNIELIQPLVPDSPEARFLERRGEGPYLVTLEVDDLDAEVKALKGKGIPVTVTEMTSGPARWRAFIHPRATHGVLLSLYQPGK